MNWEIKPDKEKYLWVHVPTRTDLYPVQVHYPKDSNLFPYTGYIEEYDNLGNVTTRKITIDAATHYRCIGSPNVFLNNIYLKKIDNYKDDNFEKIYSINTIWLQDKYEFLPYKMSAFDNTYHKSTDTAWKEIKSGAINEDTASWYDFVRKATLRYWYSKEYANNVIFVLNELFNFSCDISKSITADYYSMLNDFKIHKIIKSDVHFRQPNVWMTRDTKRRY